MAENERSDDPQEEEVDEVVSDPPPKPVWTRPQRPDSVLPHDDIEYGE